MALSREAKEKQLAGLQEQLADSQLTVVCDYQGLTVAEMQELRHALKEQDSAFKVIKKNLVTRALATAKIDGSGLDMEGQLGLAFGLGDEVSVAQVLAGFVKNHPALEIKNGINVEGIVLSPEEVQHLATLPSKEQLRAQVVGTVAGPLRGFVTVLEGNLRGLVSIFNELKEQKA